MSSLPLFVCSVACHSEDRVWQTSIGAWDDDDWTGEPPEGRYSAERANPGFWRDNRAPLSITGAGVGIALIILALVLLL
jgi:hypothetical protein